MTIQLNRLESSVHVISSLIEAGRLMVALKHFSMYYRRINRIKASMVALKCLSMYLLINTVSMVALKCLSMYYRRINRIKASMVALKCLPMYYRRINRKHQWLHSNVCPCISGESTEGINECTKMFVHVLQENQQKASMVALKCLSMCSTDSWQVLTALRCLIRLRLTDEQLGYNLILLIFLCVLLEGPEGT